MYKLICSNCGAVNSIYTKESHVNPLIKFDSISDEIQRMKDAGEFGPRTPRPSTEEFINQITLRRYGLNNQVEKISVPKSIKIISSRDEKKWERTRRGLEEHCNGFTLIWPDSK